MSRPTKDECLMAAARVLAESRELVKSMTPREQAEAAWTPTTPMTLDELEDRIRVKRGLPRVHDAKAS